ncbi:MAG: class I SAM-dependent methyltransferase [Candidatus Electryoneaceae bacterium]|nr:class I SAM-dependent methyltransferase [Candidatus Electryoneaceae bacterium]
MQKPITERWLREADQIYAGYEIYSQGGGDEQSAFDQGAGVSESRSKKIVEWLTTEDVPPETGKLIDIGCGNGAFLRAFGARYPKWQITGLELDSRNQQVIESIPGVIGLQVGPIASLQDRYDIIVLIHVLEHIHNPVQFLESLTDRLNFGGLLLIEVPDMEISPFDILIADHCTHFTADILHEVVTAAGFKSIAMTEDFVPKELSLLAQYPGDDGHRRVQQKAPLIKEWSPGSGATAAKNHIAWLKNLLRKGQVIEGTVGIFGTSIAATWLAESLGDKVKFFVDEDPNRIGLSHMSRPIYNPAQAPKGSHIVVPMRADIAVAIAKRFEKLTCKFVLPSV